MSNVSSMYSVEEKPTEPKKERTIQIRGRADNNIVIEDISGEKIDLPTTKYVKSLETELDKSNKIIKKLESTINRLNYELNSVKQDVNTLNQILKRK